jgi:putative ABC transport system permease protein
MEPLDQAVGAAFAPSRLRAAVWVGYAILGLGLSLIGVSTLVSSAAAKRGVEMGVRSALGATPSTVVWMLLRESLGCIAVGIVVGEAIASQIAAPLMKGLLFGLPPSDSPTSAAAALLLLVSCTLSALVPCLAIARRGAAALRHRA